jgi:hypothetical protein
MTPVKEDSMSETAIENAAATETKTAKGKAQKKAAKRKAAAPKVKAPNPRSEPAVVHESKSPRKSATSWTPPSTRSLRTRSARSL